MRPADRLVEVGERRVHRTQPPAGPRRMARVARAHGRRRRRRGRAPAAWSAASWATKRAHAEEREIEPEGADLVGREHVRGRAIAAVDLREHRRRRGRSARAASRTHRLSAGPRRTRRRRPVPRTRRSAISPRRVPRRRGSRCARRRGSRPPLRRAAAPARTRARAGSAPTTRGRRPPTTAHRFGKRWSSMVTAAAPGRPRGRQHRRADVRRAAVAGVAIRDHGRAAPRLSKGRVARKRTLSRARSPPSECA